MFVRIFFCIFLFTFRLSTEWYFVRGFLSIFRVVNRFRLFLGVFRAFLAFFVAFSTFVRIFFLLFLFTFTRRAGPSLFAKPWQNVNFSNDDWFMQHNTLAPLRNDVNECRDAFTTKRVGRLSSLEDQVLLFYTFIDRRNVSFPKNNWFMHWSTSVILRTDVNECRDAFYTKKYLAFVFTRRAGPSLRAKPSWIDEMSIFSRTTDLCNTILQHH